MKILLVLLRWLAVGVSITLLLALFSAEVTSFFFAVPSILALYFPILFALNSLLFLLFLFRKKWYALLPGMALLLCMPHIGAFYTLSSPDPPREESLSVVNLNLQGLAMFAGREPKHDRAELVSLLQELKADIICFQEFPIWKKLAGKFSDEIKQACGLPYFYQGEYLTIFSRYSIEESGKVNFGFAGNGAIYTDVDRNGQLLRVYNVHLESNQISGLTKELLEESDWNNQRSRKRVWEIYKAYREKIGIRTSQTKVLMEHIDHAPCPVLVCIDMNDGPLSYPYHALSKELQDGFRAAGSGWATTYAGIAPILRIDYIFAPSNASINEYKTLKRDYSDHYGLYCQVTLPR